MTTWISRRAFLKLSAAGVAGATLARLEAEAAEFKPPAGRMPTRVLGKTGVEVGILASGGYSSITDFPTDELAVKFIQDCLDAGITYLDAAPLYGHTDDPRSGERRYGKAIGGRRKRVYLNTKTMERDADKAMRDIETSLKLLQTDYLDCLQIHRIDPKEDIARLGKSDGVYTLLRKLKDQKVIRFIGVTTHMGAACLKNALETYEFDTVLTTFNPTRERREYEELVLPVCRRQNLGLVAMKTMGGTTQYNNTSMTGTLGALVGDGQGKAAATVLLRYALSLPVHAATSGMSCYAHLRQNLEVCYNFKPMEEKQRHAIQMALNDSDVMLAYNKPDYARA